MPDKDFGHDKGVENLVFIAVVTCRFRKPFIPEFQFACLFY